MDPVTVEAVADPNLDGPVLIEGLPGVGHVGKLAAEHLIEEHDSELVRRVHSVHLPPQVNVDEAGTAALPCAEIHAVDAGSDLLVVVGDHQAGDGVGHYRVTEAFLDVAESFGTAEVLSLGGVPVGELVEEYTVLGAVTDATRRGRFEAAGVEFRPREPSGGIVGASGLLLGLGARREVPAACLMGETSGYLVDPKSARAVLEVIEGVFGLDLGYGRLEARADEMEDVLRRLRELQGQQDGADDPSDDDLRYIG